MSSKRKGTLFLTIGILLISLLSCAPEQKPPISPAPVAVPISPVAAPAPPTSPAPPSEWDKVVQAARKEGKVNLYTNTIPPAARMAVVNAFRNKYGIGVDTVSSLSGLELAEKVAAEQRARAYVADAYEGGNSTIILMMKPQGLLSEPLVLPSTEEKVWRVDARIADPDGYIFGYSDLSPGPLINTNLVKPQDEPKSWFDLLEPRWKGKILMDDPSISGSGSNVFYAVRKYIGGAEYWRKMAQQDVKFMRNRRDEMESIVKGDYAILLGSSWIANAAIEAGAPIKFLRFKEGHQPQGFATALIKNSPRPNAGKLFMNWFLSREGQQLFSEAAKLASNRSDVSQDHLPAGSRWGPEVKIHIYTTQDQLDRGKDMELAAEIFKTKR